MIFKRSQRRLFGCAIATALVFGVSGASALDKPEEKAATPAAAKPADKKAAKSKPATPKTAAHKTAKSNIAKPAAKSAANKPMANAGQHPPLPRARPIIVASAVPMVPARGSLAPTQILPTTSFSLVSPAAAATPPATAPTAYAPPSAPARIAALPAAPLTAADSSTTPAADIALVKQALDLVRRGKTGDATTLEKSIGDPVARKVVEWTVVRSDENDAGFDRLAAFSIGNPSWPNAIMIRKRAEGALWDERRSADTVRAFFAGTKPITAKGKFALARSLAAQGDAATAAQLVRSAWREDTCSASVEKAVMESFGDVLTRADHKARMDRRFYDDDPDAGMRMAQLLGGADLLIGQARKAVVEKSSNTRALLDAVPESARNDPGYLFHKAQWLRR